MSNKSLKDLIFDTFFGAAGSAISKNQFQHTVIKRDVRMRISNMSRYRPAQRVLFMPFESDDDIFTKIASIPLAPCAFSVESLANAGAALGYALIALLHLAIFDLNGAKNDFLKSGVYLLSSVQALNCALLSPIINAIDLVVSTILTMRDGFSGSDDYETISAEEYEDINRSQANWVFA